MSLSVFNRQSMYTTACRSISGIASAGIRSGKYSFHPQTPNSSLSLSSSLFSKSIISNNNNNTQVRYLNLHEYQSKDLMSKYGIRVQKGKVANNPTEAESIAKELLSAGAKELIVKAQIHAGGRGKGKFDNGFKGGVKITTVPSEVRDYSSNMLGAKLITHQTTAEGQPVHKVLVHEGIFFDRELYFAILMDRKAGGPVIVCSPQGGVDIEEVAAKTPDKIYYQAVDINKGIQSEHTDRLATLLGFTGQSHKDAQEQMVRLYNLFIGTDATQVEINPFVQTKDGYVYCVDAKINFDDNASFRHKELFALRDPSQEDPRDVVASDFGLNYIGLDGNIACMVNGAGLAMATMDIIKLHGGEPANFLDVGGGANEKQVEEAFKLLTSDQSVKAILVNIFGGIMKCDIIATGIINAARNLKLTVPLVVRLEGTNVEKGNQLLQASGLTIITAKDLDDAAIKAVKSVKPGMSKYQTMTSMPSMQRRFFSTHSAKENKTGRKKRTPKGKKIADSEAKSACNWSKKNIEQYRITFVNGSTDEMLALSGEKAVKLPENDPIFRLKQGLKNIHQQYDDILAGKIDNNDFSILLDYASLIIRGSTEGQTIQFFSHLLILGGFYNREEENKILFQSPSFPLYQNNQQTRTHFDIYISHKVDVATSFVMDVVVVEIEAKIEDIMKQISEEIIISAQDDKAEAQATAAILASAQNNLLKALPYFVGLIDSSESYLLDKEWKEVLIEAQVSTVVWSLLCRGKTGKRIDYDIRTTMYRSKIYAEDCFNLFEGKPLSSKHRIIKSNYLFFHQSRDKFFDALFQMRKNLRHQFIPIMAVDDDGKEVIGKEAIDLIMKKLQAKKHAKK